MMSSLEDDWFACPVCGEEVRVGALVCPGCGSDDETGWSEEAEYDGVELPDDTFGDPARPTRQQSPLFTYGVIGLIVVIIVVWVLAGV